MNPAVVNISVYKFVTITDIDPLREHLKARCDQLGLKGTVLIAPEGINIFLAGSRQAIDAIVSELKADPRFADLEPKESLSVEQPFKKMWVKKKKEIITMKRPLIKPEEGRAPSVPAPTLKTWLEQGHDDEGRPVVLMDTRNAFEVDYGTFNDCIDYRIDKFSEFPDIIEQKAHEFDGKTVVTFCTGGIRCEKAAILMKETGFERVYQLDGGILKYFETVGGDHYTGGCFVFDERENLDPTLSPAK